MRVVLRVASGGHSPSGRYTVIRILFAGAVALFGATLGLSASTFTDPTLSSAINVKAAVK